MRYWYVYTGENLILGRGRAIRQVVSDIKTIGELLEIAQKQYAASDISVSRDAFIAAMMAPLAMMEIGSAAENVTKFSSVGEVLGLFENMDGEVLAANFINGIVASGYDGDAQEISTRVRQGFANGDLFILPRDSARLHAQEIFNMLPGAVLLLLASAHAKRKAFADYLRRGTVPYVSSKAAALVASLRPVLRTWEREARLEKEYRKRGGL